MQSEKKVGGAVAPAQVEVLVASFATPEPGPRPGTPSLFTDAAAAEAHMDAAMRDEWGANAPEGDDGEALAYPGSWEEAHDAMAAENDGRDAGDEMWGEHALTSHLVEVPLSAAVPRRAYDDLAEALAGLIGARPLPQDLRRVPDAQVEAMDAAEAALAQAQALQGANPVPPRPDAILIEVDPADWRAVQDLISGGISAAAASAGGEGPEAEGHRHAVEAAMRVSALAGRAIAATGTRATAGNGGAA